MFDDTKGAIRSLKSKKNKQYNDQKKKYTRTNNDLQNIQPKTNDWATRTPLKSGGELGGFPEGWAVAVALVPPVVLLCSINRPSNNIFT